ncbi:ATP-binding protein [Tepidicaulis sp. LMO-SS28]|uniref:ATP-binding protein n=1 Tax=Tepidicaulis sp. LMO-SS28 TaxID=3447455 RepID=UPI003EE29894
MADIQENRHLYGSGGPEGPAPSGMPFMIEKLKEQRYRLMGGAALFLALAFAGAISFPLAGLAFLGLAALLMGEERRAGSLSAAFPLSGAGQAQGMPDPETGLSTRVVEHLPDPVIVLDAGGRVLYRNRATLALLGAVPVGRPLAAVLRAPAILTAIDRVQRRGGSESVDHVMPVPVERYIRATVLRVGGDEQDGESVQDGAAVLIMLHDLTDLRRAEQMRVDFVANASHELKTPLASLSGFIETLQGHAKDDPEAQARFLGIMGEQAARMQRLIEDLLSLSRIEMREHVPPSGEVDLPALVSDVVDGLSPLAESHGVEINVTRAEGVQPVWGDWDELHQVVQNLAENALKYGRAGKRIDISTKPVTSPSGRTLVELAIRDYGPGIPREHIPRLTERFYRVDVSKSRERGGTGLGLAIVKHIVNRHSGTLSIDSQVGEGSTFSVRLPVRPLRPDGA